jgi:hypothetical protein
VGSFLTLEKRRDRRDE